MNRERSESDPHSLSLFRHPGASSPSPGTPCTLTSPLRERQARTRTHSPFFFHSLMFSGRRAEERRAARAARAGERAPGSGQGGTLSAGMAKPKWVSDRRQTRMRTHPVATCAWAPCPGALGRGRGGTPRCMAQTVVSRLLSLRAAAPSSSLSPLSTHPQSESWPDADAGDEEPVGMGPPAVHQVRKEKETSRRRAPHFSRRGQTLTPGPPSLSPLSSDDLQPQPVGGPSPDGAPDRT